MTEQPTGKCDIGIIGLGVMGHNLLLNMSDHGFTTAGYDKDPNKVAILKKEPPERKIFSTNDLKAFIDSIRKPRAILLLVPAGKIVDSVIAELAPHLTENDIIIDAGNSYFKDTNARYDSLKTKGFNFLGVGVSGGEEGARHGPSIMPGGNQEAYQRIKPIFEAIAAKVDDEACVAFLGPCSAGHYVKMVHNGIEYGIMQLIAESYDLMKRGLGLNNDALHEIYTQWNNQELKSYLFEITSEIFAKKDDQTSHHLIDQILSIARQKGTGMWTTESAMELQVPLPTIDLAVAMRDLSVFRTEREQLSKIYREPQPRFSGDHKEFLTELRQALYIAMNIVYAQGFALLHAASNAYGYHLNLETIATIWRGGCIIRAELLNDIRDAFKKDNNCSNLLATEYLSKNINRHQQSLRAIINQGVTMGLPIPGLMTSLAYLDAFRSNWLPTNLIQAQRDFFGAHTYERIDQPGSFHTQWQQ